jgi:hypothetical protein
LPHAITPVAVAAVANKIAARVRGRPSSRGTTGALSTLSLDALPQKGHAASVARK